MIIDVPNSRLKLFLISTFILILFSHFTFSKVPNNRSSKKAYYGAACNSTVKCDIHSLLFCEENICQCLYSDAMTYSFDLGTCVSLVNEICGYLETKRVFINCISNSFCDQQQGVCKCAQGFVESERHCLKQKGYGEPCHSDNECLSELSLTCFEETCRCDPKRYVSHSTYIDNTNLSQTKCVALAGLPCTVKTGCVTKASCVNEIGALDPNANFDWMNPGVCKCDDGYEMDNNGRCLGKYGSYCDVLANISCLENFQCLDSICHCKYPDDQIYNESLKKCVSLIGGPCTSHNIINKLEVDMEYQANEKADVLCDKFMECVNSTCVCSNGFVENIDRECDLSYGQPCTGETMSKCDKAVGLHCVNGICACKDTRREFDLTLGRCIGKIGAPCKISPVKSSSPVGLRYERRNRKTSHEKIDNDGEHSCSRNAKCKISRIHLKGLTARGFCVLSEGGTPAPVNNELQHDMNPENRRHEEPNNDQDYE